MILYILLFAVVTGYVCRADLFSAFSQGAKDGMQSAFAVLPCLAATLTALMLMEAGGALERVCRVLSPLTQWLGLPPETLPLFVLRPLSGSASLATLRDILEKYGPDSRIGLVASAMMGSGETVFYTCALYLGAAGIKKSRYIIPASLIGWIGGCFVSARFFA